MADDKNITQINAASAVTATDLIPIAQGDARLKRATARQIADFVAGQYPTRAAAVTAIAGGWVPVAGAIYHIGGLAYIGSTGATALPGLPGLLPATPARRAHWGVADLLEVGCEVVASGGMADAPTCRTRARPLVILVSGQSNSETREVFDWNPPQRIRHWSYYGSGKTDAAATVDVGLWTWAPYAQTGTTRFMSWGRSIAAQAAEIFPDRPIYLLTVAKGGISIAQWIDGAANPQMMTALRNNVPAALAGIEDETGWPVSAVDAFFWWQGENDIALTTWADSFEVFMGQMYAEDWFPRLTPVVMSGLPRFGTGWESGNKNVLRAVANEPELRVFTDPGFLPVEYWNPPTLVHMTAEGYRLAGAAAWNAFSGGGGVRPPHNFVWDSVSDLALFGEGLPSLWEWTFRRNQNGITTVAVSNGSTEASASAQLLAACGTQVEMTAFRSGASRLRSTGTGAFDIHHDNAAANLRLLTNGVSRIVISATGVVSGGSIATQFETTDGKLTTTGYAGLGGYGTGTDASSDATDLTTSFRRFTSGTLPFGSGFTIGAHISRVQNAQGAQFGVWEAGATERSRFAWRHRASNGTWAAWAEAQPISSGATATRPTSGMVAGFMFFDTTLGKPIWRNTANNGWVDATGTAV